MFEVYRWCSSDGPVAPMRWRTAAHISVAHSPRDRSTTWRFVALGTGRDSPSTTAPFSRDHRPSGRRALTFAFGTDRSRCVLAGDRDTLGQVGSRLGTEVRGRALMGGVARQYLKVCPAGVRDCGTRTT